MEPLRYQPRDRVIVEINWAARWQLYQRLQELDIPCWCATQQPLMARISNTTAAIQVWSASRQLTASRQDLVCWLERCWQYHLKH